MPLGGSSVSAVVPRVSRALVSVLAVAALGSAGCGADTPDPGKPEERREENQGGNAEKAGGEEPGTAVTAALTAFHRAPSVTMDITMDTGTHKLRGTVRAARDGQYLIKIAYGGQGTLQMIRTRGGSAYMKMDEAQIRAAARERRRSPGETESDVARVADRWIVGKRSSPAFRKGIQLCGLSATVPKPQDAAEGNPEPEKVTMDGRRLLAFTERDGDGNFGIYITEAGPVVYKVEGTGGGEFFSVVFSRYGQSVKAFHPPAGAVLTEDDLPAADRQFITGTGI